MTDNTRLPTGRFLSIDSLWAWISSDHEGEGLLASSRLAPPGLGVVPLIGADRARIESYRDEARLLGQAMGKRVVLVRFTQREELEELTPSQRPPVA